MPPLKQENGKLYIRGLDQSTTDEAFEEYFKKFGEIEKSYIARESDDTSRGFGYIRYTSLVTAQRVLTERLDLDGRTLQAESRAFPRPSKRRGEKNKSDRARARGGRDDNGFGDRSRDRHRDRFRDAGRCDYRGGRHDNGYGDRSRDRQRDHVRGAGRGEHRERSPPPRWRSDDYGDGGGRAAAVAPALSYGQPHPRVVQHQHPEQRGGDRAVAPAPFDGQPRVVQHLPQQQQWRDDGHPPLPRGDRAAAVAPAPSPNISAPRVFYHLRFQDRKSRTASLLKHHVKG